MITKAITFRDLEGNKVTRNFHFHMSKDELIRLQVEDRRGLKAAMEAIQESQDAAGALDWIEKIILLAVGEKSEDGLSFEKSEAYRRYFKGTDAYSELIWGIFNSDDQGASFFGALIPQWVREELDEHAKTLPEQQTPELAPTAPVLEEPAVQTVVDKPQVTEKQFGDYTRAELVAMSAEEFNKLVGTTDPNKMSREQLMVAMQRKSAGE